MVSELSKSIERWTAKRRVALVVILKARCLGQSRRPHGMVKFLLDGKSTL
jgi:hypothetical protein